MGKYNIGAANDYGPDLISPSPNHPGGTFMTDMRNFMPSAGYLIQALKDRLSGPGRVNAAFEAKRNDEMQKAQEAFNALNAAKSGVAQLNPMMVKKLQMNQSGGLNGIADRLASTDRPGDYQ